jgi:alpha-ketoglutaric semialdehyde dehydrogenase
MTTQPVLIEGQWRPSSSPEGSFSAMNPTAGQPMDDAYPVSSYAEIERALLAAQGVIEELRGRGPDAIADFLEAFAANIEAGAETLVELCHLETALPVEPRLRSVELPRTTDQLRQAAAAARERSWRLATIDTERNIRSMYGPLPGPVAVFGPNNFPFAFNGVAGGDFAAAIAASNPVIAKANPGHPGTTRLLAEAAHRAVLESGLPPAMVQLIYRMKPENGLKFVSHPLLGATGFTGSRSGGLRLKAAADAAGVPIYLEMSSVNPVFILPGALEERLAEIAAELFASCQLGAGQFCTNPGLVILLEGGQSERFIDRVGEHFRETPPGVLLGESGPGQIDAAVAGWQAHGAELLAGGRAVEGAAFRYANTLLRVSGEAFLANPEALQTEAFGTASLLVVARDVEQLLAIVGVLEGNLTGSLYSHSGGDDDAFYDEIEPPLRGRVGRLLNDKMPTGVAVSPAMNHGGPYPATGHPGFTAVGIPASMLRFAALHSYDNVRHHRLPAELQDKNPTGRTWRFVDGEWTQRDL